MQTNSRCVRTREACVIQYVRKGKEEREKGKLKSYSNLKIRSERICCSFHHHYHPLLIYFIYYYEHHK